MQTHTRADVDALLLRFRPRAPGAAGAAPRVGFRDADAAVDALFSASPPIVLQPERAPGLSRGQSGALSRKASSVRRGGSGRGSSGRGLYPRKKSSAKTDSSPAVPYFQVEEIRPLKHPNIQIPPPPPVPAAAEGGNGSDGGSGNSGDGGGGDGGGGGGSGGSDGDGTAGGRRPALGRGDSTHGAARAEPAAAPPPPVVVPSGISLLFGAGDQGGTAGGVPMLKILAYLPDRSPLKFKLKESGTIEDTIVEILRLHRESGNDPPLRGGADCYELRLHDEDGEPDEDFPALERTRQVQKFSDEDVYEFCICVVEGKDPDASVAAPAAAAAEKTDAAAKAIAEAQARIIRINMPNGLYTKVNKTAKEDQRLRDIIPMLAIKHRLPLFRLTVQFEVSEEDRARLQLYTNVLDLDTVIASLDVSVIKLTFKKYADAPTKGPLADLDWMLREDRPEIDADEQQRRKEAAAKEAADKGGGESKNSGRPPESLFDFNEGTAAVYREWRVTKTNKWGRRQRRVMGIDLYKVFNKKVDLYGRRGSVSGTKRKERLISDIRGIAYVKGSATSFTVTYREDGSSVVQEYEADTPSQCVEIVVKLKTVCKVRKIVYSTEERL